LVVNNFIDKKKMPAKHWRRTHSLVF